jgi:hypothetical protein
MTSPADVKALRNIYIQNPPEGISPDRHFAGCLSMICSIWIIFFMKMMIFLMTLSLRMISFSDLFSFV